MVAGPELSRMVEEFEGSFTVSEERDHHEQKPGVQSTFLKDVVNTVSSFEELGNPFTEESENLMAMHTKDIMDDNVVATVKNAHKIGEEQFCLFVKERFIGRSINQLQIHLRRTASLHLVLQLRRLYRKTRQKLNC